MSICGFDCCFARCSARAFNTPYLGTGMQNVSVVPAQCARGGRVSVGAARDRPPKCAPARRPPKCAPVRRPPIFTVSVGVARDVPCAVCAAPTRMQLSSSAGSGLSCTRPRPPRFPRCRRQRFVFSGSLLKRAPPEEGGLGVDKVAPWRCRERQRGRLTRPSIPSRGFSHSEMSSAMAVTM